MNEKRELLKQLGWSEELINECLVDKDYQNGLRTEPPDLSRTLPRTEQNVSNLIISVNEPSLTDGSCL